MKNKNKFYVYVLRRPDKPDPFDPEKDCPFYIGKGQTHRVGEHRREAQVQLKKKNCKHPRLAVIHKLWRNNQDFIEEVIIDGLSEQDAIDIEIALIEMYGRKDNGTGCLTNLTNGGEGMSGWVPSEETIERMKKASKGRKLPLEAIERIRQSRLGKSFTEEHKKNLSESHKGYKHTEEQRKKNSQSQRNRPKESYEVMADKLRGRNYQTPESKERIGSAQRGKEVSVETREKLSVSIKELWQDEDYRHRCQESHKGYVMPEAQKEKIRASVKETKARQKAEREQAKRENNE